MSSQQLLVTYEGNIQKILFNRPEKRNAISFDIYTNLVKILQSGATDFNVTLTVLSGVGDYYSSGNDMTNNPTDLINEDTDTSITLQKYVAAFIDYPKPLIAIVNGPAIGISATTLALCDIVFASDTATFHTPFTLRGMTPEGCSSVLFPRIFGNSVASELLYTGRKLNAQEALQYGFVSGVFTTEEIERDLWPRIHAWAKLPPQSMIFAKQLVRVPMLSMLHEANKRECKRLEERWESEEFMNAITAFFNRKSKL
ncbi:enoyl-CoA delta isomerase 2, mitochondrial isoform X2 [Diaphorina citri]|uniref:Enoyl-CoA delta isomerase 2, mitochondrial isoform X2 n=1 Tax=Diaphorina citri TaxID=121845 RepID=A0A3Q0J992_DIACI|nr:enoyl-CoA delta isomerase 2, mitochondrial isoform X2 [Diaphorina citri]